MNQATRDFDTFKVQILPVLRRPTEAPGLALVPGHLEIGLVLDTLNGEVQVGQADLRRWGATFAEAYDAALTNLKERSKPTDWEDVATVQGMRVYIPGTGDACARALILPELLEQFPAEGVLFACPSPQQFMAVPLHNFSHLPAVRVLVTAAHLAFQNSSSPLSEQIFWFDGEQVWHIKVVHDGDNVDILAPPEFLEAVERLASMSMISAVAEA